MSDKPVKSPTIVTPAKPAATRSLEKKTNSRETRGVRMEDIAREAGVSRGTVSKVLFPEGTSSIRVSEKTAERIRKVADQMGYLPNLSAKQLAGEQSRLVGVLIDSFGSSVYYQMLQQLERHMALHGYRLIVGQVHDDVGSIAEYLKDFAGRGVEGVVSFVHSYPQFQKEIQTLYRSVKSIKNLVCVGEPKITERDHINIDTALGVELLVRHLYQTGRRRIALFVTASGFASSSARVEGFERGVQGVSLERSACPVYYVKRSLGMNAEEQDIFDALDELIKAHPDLDAVIASNDIMGLYVIQYLTEQGISIPRQIAVTGFDNTEFSAASCPALTTVDQNTQELAKNIAELIFSRVANPDRKAKTVIISPRLVLRKSTHVPD